MPSRMRELDDIESDIGADHGTRVLHKMVYGFADIKVAVVAMRSRQIDGDGTVRLNARNGVEYGCFQSPAKFKKTSFDDDAARLFVEEFKPVGRATDDTSLHKPSPSIQKAIGIVWNNR